MVESDVRSESGPLFAGTAPSFDWVDRRAVALAVGVGVLVNLAAFVVPSFRVVGGGLLAGVVAGYAAGRPGRGVLQGAIAAGGVGVGAAVVVITSGSLLGLYVEPPATLLRVYGPVSPTFTPAGGVGLLLLAGVLTLLVAADGVVGGLVGGSLGALVDRRR